MKQRLRIIVGLAMLVGAVLLVSGCGGQRIKVNVNTSDGSFEKTIEVPEVTDVNIEVSD